MCFSKHKLAIKFDEKIEKQKAIEKELDCNFIRINPDEMDFDRDIESGKIYNHNNKSSKKSLIDKNSKRLSELEFTSNHLIKSNAKKILASL